MKLQVQPAQRSTRRGPVLAPVAQNTTVVSGAPSAAHTTSGLHRLSPIMEIDDSWLEAMDDEVLAMDSAEPSLPAPKARFGFADEQAQQAEIEQLRAELVEARAELQRLRNLLADKSAVAVSETHEVVAASQAAAGSALPTAAPPLPRLDPPPTTSVPSAHASPVTAQGIPLLRQLCISSIELSDSVAVTENQATDRRNNQRRAYEQHVEFVAESHFFAGLTQDISTGGLFVATYELLPVGTKLSIQLEMPDGSELEVQGVVRWLRREATQDSERPGLGIAFTDLSEENLARIRAFCQERPPLYVEV